MKTEQETTKFMADYKKLKPNTVTLQPATKQIKILCSDIINIKYKSDVTIYYTNTHYFVCDKNPPIYVSSGNSYFIDKQGDKILTPDYMWVTLAPKKNPPKTYKGRC